MCTCTLLMDQSSTCQKKHQVNDGKTIASIYKHRNNSKNDIATAPSFPL
jgi:hypothetical protein